MFFYTAVIIKPLIAVVIVAYTNIVNVQHQKCDPPFRNLRIKLNDKHIMCASEL